MLRFRIGPVMPESGVRLACAVGTLPGARDVEALGLDLFEVRQLTPDPKSPR